MCFGCEFIDVVDVLALLALGSIKGGGVRVRVRVRVRVSSANNKYRHVLPFDQ